MPGLLYDPAAWDEILRRVADGYSQFPFGGLEVGGVLYGIREGDTVRVLDSRPIVCEHTSGPAFTLSEEETAALEQRLRTYSHDRALRELVPVGWYHSRTRGEIQMTAEDRALHSRCFTEPWQVAVVLRPAELLPTKVGVFSQGQDGALEEQPQLSQFNHIVAQPYREPPPPRARRRVYWLWAAAICASLAAGIVGARWIGRPVAAPSLALRAAEEEELLAIRWDTAAKALKGARGADIEILDQGRRTTLFCDPECLARGLAIYQPTSTTVEVRMRVVPTSGPAVEEFTRFVGRRVPGKPTTEEVAASAKKEQIKHEVAGMRAEIEDRSTQAKELEARLKSMRGATQRKPLVVPAAALGAKMQPPALTPAPPVLTGAGTLPQAPLAGPLAPLAPPPVAAAHPASGKFVWIGELPKNGLLSITGHQASAGTLTGGLPGVPVRVGVYPAELAASGLVVYSTNPRYARGAVTEAPGEHNGWNRTSYVWDDRHQRDLLVVETPGARNHWNRLVIRSQTRRLAVVVVEWESE